MNTVASTTQKLSNNKRQTHFSESKSATFFSWTQSTSSSVVPQKSPDQLGDVLRCLDDNDGLGKHLSQVCLGNTRGDVSCILSPQQGIRGHCVQVISVELPHWWCFGWEPEWSAQKLPEPRPASSLTQQRRILCQARQRIPASFCSDSLSYFIDHGVCERLLVSSRSFVVVHVHRHHPDPRLFLLLAHSVTFSSAHPGFLDLQPQDTLDM